MKSEIITTKLSDYSDVLTPRDLMEILHTGRNTVYRYLKEGRIRSIMIGNSYRIPQQYLAEYLGIHSVVEETI